MEETKISSLSIRVNEPYWLIHAGNCEHFIVINQIRFVLQYDPMRMVTKSQQVTPFMWSSLKLSFNSSDVASSPGFVSGVQ